MNKVILKQLWQALQQELEGYRRLHRLLQHQARLLTGQDHQGLLSHNPGQIRLTEQLAGLAARRETLQVELGAASLEQLCHKLPAPLSGRLGELWQGLQQQARLCRALNDSNGRLLASQKEWLERRLGVTEAVYQPV
ncbi:flagellar export chaperone FlgN [Oceanimonas sp. CHS3-5]|uniref:flagellar export chaperone FlgN n=1 Tax=Oceanimonas sp. CHS3-5 TaxID=3068186 RepID=UPI00273F0A51|nr:flagellar export chaperone FlgN [Oceanimonas sp. CHS3-5]MDP5292394.1 flagellar export chaperone FlgN [Oceanimonas sp. CHS3-5]